MRAKSSPKPLLWAILNVPIAYSPGSQEPPLAQTSGGGVTTAVTGEPSASLAAQWPAVPRPSWLPFWKTKLAVHQANPSGTDLPPTLVQNRDRSHVPGPRPTGGRSTPLGVLGTPPPLGAAPPEYRHGLLPPPPPPEGGPFAVGLRSIEDRGTPRGPAAITRWYSAGVNHAGAGVEIGTAVPQPSCSAPGAAWADGTTPSARTN